jgi:hypothetical protein
VAQHLRGPPQPHFAHPYWRGAIATVQEAARGRLSPEALRRILGTPSRRGFWVERLRALVIGYPPRVRPWHPRWADYRPVLRRLLPVLDDPARQILHVTDAPTLFSVMLAKGGGRIASVQTTPLLQSTAGGIGFERRFDLCLIELDQRDVKKTGALVRRLVPGMKTSGCILIAIRESEPMPDAPRFAADLGEALRREAPAARLEEVQCVPASSLRTWCYRTFARLGADAHQRPWVGLPALALFAVPLGLLTLVLNLFAAMRTTPGTASSLHIVMRSTTLG